MRPDIVEWVARVPAEDGTPLIVCEHRDPAPSDPQLWVFREKAPNRLEQRWSGTLQSSEIDELVGRLRERHPVWLGAIDTCHPAPSRRFRLVWTLAPAPCRLYTRRRLAVHVEPTGATRHRLRRRERVAVPESSVVEGWISSDWTWSGISLKGDRGEEAEIFRLKGAGLFAQFLIMYDGIDLMMDTWWLDGVVPRVAEVLGLPWRIVDYTETPPKVVQESATAAAPVPTGE
jgi:hypothetical protein